MTYDFVIEIILEKPFQSKVDTRMRWAKIVGAQYATRLKKASPPKVLRNMIDFVVAVDEDEIQLRWGIFSI